MDKPSSTTCLFAHGLLIDFATEVLTGVGVPKADARLAADSLVAANLRGVDTHGIVRLPIYVDRLRQGLVNVSPDIKVVSDGPTTVVVDGDAGLGQVAVSYTHLTLPTILLV